MSGRADRDTDNAAPLSPKEDGREGKAGVLYVVSTPIGNLEDITLRAISVLKSVDLIAAENMAHTQGLCNHYGIRNPVTGYRRENQKSKGPELVRRVKAGERVALVTDAGTPGISDPGAYLIRLAAQEGVRVSPVPGPSAVTAALSVSGFSTEEFVFGGFLPPKPGKRRRILEGLRSESRPVVLFEAPHRIKATLEDLGEIMGDRPMVALREMTKRFEDVRRGTAAEILAGLSPESVRGEFTLVVSGSREKVPDEVGEEARGKIDELVAEGRLGVKEMALLLSEETGLPYRMLYKECLAEMKGAETHRTMELVKQFRIRNSMGLHARAAAKIVDLSNKFKSRLYLKKDGQEVDGSSILSILTLSCPKGCEIEARIAGEDCREFMDGLGLLFEQRFGEDR